MTNDEIWEWMQRDLDGDLSLEEQDALYSLIRKDSDLQLKYNRLKTVSQQLEQLPPVVPSFSIVDSILPQLESAVAKPAATYARNEEILPVLEVKQKVPSSPETRKWKRMNVWLASIGSTAVAACLLIGIFFTGSDGKKSEFDPYQQGTEAVTPTDEKAPVIGPPAPPPSTNPSSINHTETDKKTTQPPATAEKQNTRKASDQNQKNSVNPAVKPPAKPAAATTPVPPTPVAREEKPPAFPYGLEDKSDKEENDHGNAKEKGASSKAKEKNNDKQNNERNEGKKEKANGKN